MNPRPLQSRPRSTGSLPAARRVSPAPSRSTGASPVNSRGRGVAATHSRTTGASPGRAGASLLCADLTRLPAPVLALVEQMMVEGATLEDVVDAVHERHQIRISLQAVQNLFRSRLDLQQRRIKRQLETARALKKALGAPQSGQAELADAVLLTGLMRVHRRTAEFHVRDAVFEKYQRENLRLRQQTADLVRKKFFLDKRLLQARLQTEALRSEHLREKLLEFRHALESQKNPRTLGPEALQKIQEIYGLLPKTQSPAPAPASAQL